MSTAKGKFEKTHYEIGVTAIKHTPEFYLWLFLNGVLRSNGVSLSAICPFAKSNSPKFRSTSSSLARKSIGTQGG